MSYPFIPVSSKLKETNDDFLNVEITIMLMTWDCFFVAASSSDHIGINQKATSWVNQGRTYNRYSTTLTNMSNKTLKDLKLSISKLYGPIWGLTKIRKILTASQLGSMSYQLERASNLFTFMLQLLPVFQSQVTDSPKEKPAYRFVFLELWGCGCNKLCSF